MKMTREYIFRKRYLAPYENDVLKIYNDYLNLKNTEIDLLEQGVLKGFSNLDCSRLKLINNHRDDLVGIVTINAHISSKHLDRFKLYHTFFEVYVNLREELIQLLWNHLANSKMNPYNSIKKIFHILLSKLRLLTEGMKNNLLTIDQMMFLYEANNIEKIASFIKEIGFKTEGGWDWSPHKKHCPEEKLDFYKGDFSGKTKLKWLNYMKEIFMCPDFNINKYSNWE